MKQNRQFVRVNSDFINKNLSAGAVKVLFLLASIAQAGGSDTAVISNARIAERTKLTNITRIINELYAIGAVTERIQRFKSNRQKCNAYVLSEAVSAPKNYVLVPVSAVELPKSCLRLFMLYCIHASAEGRCLLSLSMIQELSGMARGTIISCNKELTEQGYIAKQQYVRREGDFGYNRVYISHLLRRRVRPNVRKHSVLSSIPVFSALKVNALLSVPCPRSQLQNLQKQCDICSEIPELHILSGLFSAARKMLRFFFARNGVVEKRIPDL